MQTLFLLLLIIPFFYRYFFWSYVFQLKEYRADRLKDYLCSPQGRKTLFSKLFFVEIFILFYTFLNLLADFYFDYFIYFILAYLSVLNLFYLVKLLFKKYFFPEKTLRQKISSFITLIFIAGYFFIIYYFNLFYFIYFNISALFLVFFPQIIIFLSNFLILPLVNYQKQKLINKAKIKSENNEKTIKIGVTGSYGKSSVKEYLSFLLGESGKTLSTKENINTEMGVTSVILEKLNESYDYFVAEMGAYKVGEIKLLGEIVNHKYGFLTAVGNQHIGLFGSLENIKKGKSEIALKVLENNGTLYVNGDNENIRSIKFPKGLKIVTYGVFKENDAISKIVGYDGEFMEFKFLYKHKEFLLKTNLLGDHNIVNITGVLAFLFDIGVDIESIKDKLLKLPKPKHTLKVSKKKGFTIIDDTYNLSVEGLFSGINVLNYFDGEKILIVDDILELGKIAPETHYDIGKSIGIMKKVDKVFFVGENYEEYFVSGLIDAGFSQENILNDLKNVSKNSVLLFEGRKARNYIDFGKNIL